MISIFEYSDYKRFLKDFEASRKTIERGFRSKLAEHVGCQSGYVTRILNESAHFSLEQALSVTEFLKLSEKERHYFLLLVERERAGTKALKSYFASKLSTERENHLNIKERIGESRALTEAEQSVYYSSWHYTAIHMLTTIPGFDSKERIAQALRLPASDVTNALLFMLQTGILFEEKGRIRPGLTQIHLNRESPLIRQHLTSWRIAAIQSLATANKGDVHYSTISTLSATDAERLKDKMLKLIEEYVATVKPSQEEVMFNFNLDFYSLIK